MANRTCSSSSVVLLILTVLLSFDFTVHSSQDISPENCMYIIYLQTSDVENAGTTANVTLKLYDNQGHNLVLENLKLKGHMGPNYVYFDRGQLDVFAFTAACLPSNVCKIELSHDNSGDHPDWHVDFLEVNVAKPQIVCGHQSFGIHQWLAQREPPQQLFVTKDVCGVGRKVDEISAISYSSYGIQAIKTVVKRLS